MNQNSENHQKFSMQKIDWNVPIGLSEEAIDQARGQNKLVFHESIKKPISDHVNDFFIVHFELLKRVFGIPQTDVRLGVDTLPDTNLAVFTAHPAIEKRKDSEIKFNQELFDLFCESFQYYWLLSIAKEKKYKDSHKISETEFLDHEVQLGGLLVNLVHALAHEAYHARQYYQDKEYYSRTMQVNLASQLIAPEVEAVLFQNGIIKEKPSDQYKKDTGEMSANAFSIVYLKKIRKMFLSEPIEGDPIPKLFLLKVDGVIAQLTERLIENRKIRN